MFQNIDSIQVEIYTDKVSPFITRVWKQAIMDDDAVELGFFAWKFNCQGKKDPLTVAAADRIHTVIRCSQIYCHGKDTNLQESLNKNNDLTIKCHRSCVSTYCSSKSIINYKRKNDKIAGKCVVPVRWQDIPLWIAAVRLSIFGCIVSSVICNVTLKKIQGTLNNGEKHIHSTKLNQRVQSWKSVMKDMMKLQLVFGITWRLC